MVSIMAFIMCAEYVYFIMPELIPEGHPIIEFFLPLVVNYRLNVRIAFVLVSILAFAVSQHSQFLSDVVRNSISSRLIVFSTFIASAVYLVICEKLSFEVYTFLYPLAILIFQITGFIIANLFKSKRGKLADFGFKPTKHLRDTENSFNWHSKKDGYINITNPFQGSLVIGGAGAGKSYTVAEPMIEQAVEKGYTMFIYDYKMPTLSRYVLDCVVNSGIKPAQKDENGNWIGEHIPLENDRRRLYMIQFQDPLRSHRVNPISPRYMDIPAQANEYAMAIMNNLVPDMAKKEDFFSISAVAYLKAIFWFLREEAPESCTLPHAISIALQPYRKVLTALQINDKAYDMIASIKTADDKNAEGQLAGVVASLQTPIDRINSPEIYWILSGDEVDLDVNNPENPSIVCMGNVPKLDKTYGPVCALIATAVMKNINEQGRLKSMFMLDEAPTLMVPGISRLPATARSNKVATVFMAQDVSQIEGMYGEHESRSIIGNLGNQFWGMVNDTKTAGMATDMIGKMDKEMKSINASISKGGQKSKSEGEQYSVQKHELIEKSEVMQLEMGRFVGKVTDTPKEDPAVFSVRPDIVKQPGGYAFNEFVRVVDGKGVHQQYNEAQMKELIDDNYKAIRKKAAELIDVSARVVCAQDVQLEHKTFPEHFDGQGNRIKDLYGNAVNEFGEVEY